MKSLRDEICLAAGEADFISSEEERRRFHPSLLGFHREAISSTKGGSIPPSADLVEKKTPFVR
jgi:hypothetical protein